MLVPRYDEAFSARSSEDWAEFHGEFDLRTSHEEATWVTDQKDEIFQCSGMLVIPILTYLYFITSNG